MKHPATSSAAKIGVLMLGLMLCLCGITTVSSFLLPTITSKQQHFNAARQQSSSSSSSSLVVCDMSSSKQPNTYYNDDAFGLVFLGGAALAQDPIFAGVFLVTSAVAATASAQGNLPSSDNKIPAAVAGISLVLTPVVTAIIASFPDVLPLDVPTTAGSPNARLIELALCSISIVYGLVTAANNNNDDDDDDDDNNNQSE